MVTQISGFVAWTHSQVNARPFLKLGIALTIGHLLLTSLLLFEVSFVHIWDGSVMTVLGWLLIPMLLFKIILHLDAGNFGDFVLLVVTSSLVGFIAARWILQLRTGMSGFGSRAKQSSNSN